uniref:Immunoglobulin domain-containing protein n=1 Tax=Ailuropoda melanoleuca TaxID=9646 RepID=A0A7N5JND2_AILME
MAGSARTPTLTALLCLGERSGKEEGWVYGAPSLSANPGPVVVLGGTVSLSCSSQVIWGSLHLLKEGGADTPQHVELTSHPETYHALFPVGPVNTSHAGTYRCYASPQSYPYMWSQPSDPLHLQVTGEGWSPGVDGGWVTLSSWGQTHRWEA